MKTLSPELSNAGRAVGNHKPTPYRRLKALIVRAALARLYVYPGDIPEDAVRAEDRQGVASNVWSELWSLEILERLPMNYCDESAGIVNGRKRNTNLHAKGRWTAVYRLASRARALAWLRANGEPVIEPAVVGEQMELLG
jgi:hypothetical protein